jgi:hypothetical protein
MVRGMDSLLRKSHVTQSCVTMFFLFGGHRQICAKISHVLYAFYAKCNSVRKSRTKFGGKLLGFWVLNRNNIQNHVDKITIIGVVIGSRLEQRRMLKEEHFTEIGNRHELWARTYIKQRRDSINCFRVIETAALQNHRYEHFEPTWSSIQASFLYILF